MTIPLRLLAASSATALLILTAACSRNESATVPTNNSSGQVTVKANASVTMYAATRFADQVSFGPTPALVSEIQSKGFEQWIDDQFALPASKVDPSPLVLSGVDDSDPGAAGRFVPTTSTDQFGAGLMQWMGLPTSQITTAFPNLKNFSEKTLPFMKL